MPADGSSQVLSQIIAILALTITGGGLYVASRQWKEVTRKNIADQQNDLFEQQSERFKQQKALYEQQEMLYANRLTAAQERIKKLERTNDALQVQVDFLTRQLQNIERYNNQGSGGED